MTRDEAIAAVARFWWEKAQESQKAARRDLAAGAYALAINRAYYALFYAVSALLLEEGHRFKKHGGVRAAFNQHLIKPGHLSSGHDHSWSPRTMKISAPLSASLSPRWWGEGR